MGSDPSCKNNIAEDLGIILDDKKALARMAEAGISLEVPYRSELDRLILQTQCILGGKGFVETSDFSIVEDAADALKLIAPGPSETIFRDNTYFAEPDPSHQIVIHFLGERTSASTIDFEESYPTTERAVLAHIVDYSGNFGIVNREDHLQLNGNPHLLTVSLLGDQITDTRCIYTGAAFESLSMELATNSSPPPEHLDHKIRSNLKLAALLQGIRIDPGELHSIDLFFETNSQGELLCYCGLNTGISEGEGVACLKIGLAYSGDLEIDQHIPHALVNR